MTHPAEGNGTTETDFSSARKTKRSHEGRKGDFTFLFCAEIVTPAFDADDKKRASAHVLLLSSSYFLACFAFTCRFAFSAAALGDMSKANPSKLQAGGAAKPREASPAPTRPSVTTDAVTAATPFASNSAPPPPSSSLGPSPAMAVRRRSSISGAAAAGMSVPPSGSALSGASVPISPAGSAAQLHATHPTPEPDRKGQLRSGASIQVTDRRVQDILDYELPVYSEEPGTLDLLRSLLPPSRLSLQPPTVAFSPRRKSSSFDVDGRHAGGSASGGEPASWHGHRDVVKALAIDEDEGILVSVSWDETAIVWNLDDGTVKAVLPHGEWVNCVVLVPVVHLHTPSNAPGGAAPDGDSAPVPTLMRRNSMAFATDVLPSVDPLTTAANSVVAAIAVPSYFIVTGSEEGKLTFWEKPRPSSTMSSADGSSRRPSRFQESATSSSPRNPLRPESNNSDDTGSGSESSSGIMRAEPEYLVRHQVTIGYAAIIAVAALKAELIFAAMLQCVVSVHIATGTVVREYMIPSSRGTGGSSNTTSHLDDASPPSTGLWHTHRVHAGVPDFTSLAVAEESLYTGCDDGRILVWDILGAFVLRELNTATVAVPRGHHFIPSNDVGPKASKRTAAATTSMMPSTQPPPDGAPSRPLQGQTNQNSGKQHQNGSSVVPRAHVAAVRCLFLSNHNVLYSGSDDGLVCAWAVSTGACVRTIKGHKKSVRCVAAHVGEKERFIISSSHDGTIRCGRLVSPASVVIRSCLAEALVIGTGRALRHKLAAAAVMAERRRSQMPTNRSLAGGGEASPTGGGPSKNPFSDDDPRFARLYCGDVNGVIRVYTLAESEAMAVKILGNVQTTTSPTR